MHDLRWASRASVLIIKGSSAKYKILPPWKNKMLPPENLMSIQDFLPDDTFFWRGWWFMGTRFIAIWIEQSRSPDLSKQPTKFQIQLKSRATEKASDWRIRDLKLIFKGNRLKFFCRGNWSLRNTDGLAFTRVVLNHEQFIHLQCNPLTLNYAVHLTNELILVEVKVRGDVG